MTHYFQQVLTGFATDSQTNTTNSTSTSPSSVASSDLITFLLEFSALRDWLKLIFLGAFFETCRRLSSILYAKFHDALFVNATFSDSDASYGM